MRGDGRNGEAKVSLVPLGGLGEIGLNMMVFECRDSAMVVDAGLMFPEDHMLGVDAVIPAISYLVDRGPRLVGIVLTHGHEDHIGALPYILDQLNAPVYGTRFTLALLREKLREHGMLEHCDLRLMEPGHPFSLGPFQIDPIPVSHTILDGVGLAIGTPVGTIVHSGDFKMDDARSRGYASDWDRFAYYGERGVLALLSDSTNVEKEGHTLSESKVAEKLEAVFSRCAGRIVLAVFASNLHRIQQAVNLSVSLGRKIAFVGKSMTVNVRIARELGYLDIPPGMEIAPRQVARYPDSEVTLITTGSQGEPLAALTLMALRRHGVIRLKPGDTVVLSSRFIPGHERAITEIINLLYRQGAEVIYESVSEIHASGHAYQEEQEALLRLTRPRYFIPIHGEYRHLVKHARLAVRTGVPPDRALVVENGDRVVFDAGGARIEGQVEVGRVFVDGKGVGDVGYPVLRDRNHLARDGMVVAVVVVDQRSGELMCEPEILSRGLMLEECQDEFIQYVQRIIVTTLEEYRRCEALDWTEFKQSVCRAVRRLFNRMLNRRPVVLCAVVAM